MSYKLCKKINFSDNTRAEFNAMVENIDNFIRPRLNFAGDTHRAWCIEDSGTHTVLFEKTGTDRTKDNVIFHDATWQLASEKIDNFQNFFSKYKLKNFWNSTVDDYIQPHRHVSPMGIDGDGKNRIELSSYNVVHISNHAVFKIVEPIGWKDPLWHLGFNQGFDENGKEQKFWHCYSDLPDGVEYKTVVEIETQPGDVLFFNGWDWHTLEGMQAGTHRSSQLWARYAINEVQAQRYLDFIESL